MAIAQDLLRRTSIYKRDPNTAEAGLYWLKRLKEDYGIVK
jgi:hypothetical protein